MTTVIVVPLHSDQDAAEQCQAGTQATPQMCRERRGHAVMRPWAGKR
jgi:hypothetical protein